MNCDSCAIKNLVYQYADLIDRGELRAVAALFRRGRVIGVDASGKRNELEGEESVYGMYESFTRIYPDDGTPHTKHVTTNVMVEVDDDAGTASARSYAVVFQSLDDFPIQPIIGVRYADRFARDGDGWFFTERQIESDQFGDLSRHLLQSMGEPQTP